MCCIRCFRRRLLVSVCFQNVYANVILPQIASLLEFMRVIVNMGNCARPLKGGSVNIWRCICIGQIISSAANCMVIPLRQILEIYLRQQNRRPFFRHDQFPPPLPIIVSRSNQSNRHIISRHFIVCALHATSKYAFIADS